MSTRRPTFTFFLHDPDTSAMGSLRADADGVEVTVEQVPARNFLGDTIFQLVVAISGGVAAEVLADAILRLLRSSRASKIVYLEEEIAVERHEIVRVVRRRMETSDDVP